MDLVDTKLSFCHGVEMLKDIDWGLQVEIMKTKDVSGAGTQLTLEAVKARKKN